VWHEYLPISSIQPLQTVPNICKVPHELRHSYKTATNSWTKHAGGSIDRFHFQEIKSSDREQTTSLANRRAFASIDLWQGRNVDLKSTWAKIHHLLTSNCSK